MFQFHKISFNCFQKTNDLLLPLTMVNLWKWWDVVGDDDGSESRWELILFFESTMFSFFVIITFLFTLCIHSFILFWCRFDDSYIILVSPFIGEKNNKELIKYVSCWWFFLTESMETSLEDFKRIRARFVQRKVLKYEFELFTKFEGHTRNIWGFHQQAIIGDINVPSKSTLKTLVF